MILPHATSGVVAQDGSVLRVDVIAGQRVTTRHMPNLIVGQRVVGTYEAVHRRHLPPSAAGGRARKHHSDLWEIHV